MACTSAQVDYSLLEKRSEPEARRLLVDDLFRCVEPPHDRMRTLVRRGDELLDQRVVLVAFHSDRLATEVGYCSVVAKIQLQCLHLVGKLIGDGRGRYDMGIAHSQFSA